MNVENHTFTEKVCIVFFLSSIIITLKTKINSCSLKNRNINKYKAVKEGYYVEGKR